MGYKFDDVNADIPLTEREISAEIADLVANMAEIDVQFAFHKNGSEVNPDPSWHGRALAAKGHMMRRVRALRAAKVDLLEQSRRAASEARNAEKAANKMAAMERSEAAQAKWRQKFYALQDWVWNAFPEHREAIRVEIMRLKND